MLKVLTSITSPPKKSSCGEGFHANMPCSLMGCHRNSLSRFSVGKQNNQNSVPFSINIPGLHVIKIVGSQHYGVK